jgi:hypothetical protein
MRRQLLLAAQLRQFSDSGLIVVDSGGDHVVSTFGAQVIGKFARRLTLFGHQYSSQEPEGELSTFLASAIRKNAFPSFRILN